MEIVKALVDFASRLDEEHLVSVASVVDGIAENLVKTSQYVGPQGYWIRNERCWSNCYRQKRASSPNKAAQEVWLDCQKEFEASINNDGSSWDKYAETDVIVKTAARDALDNRFTATIRTATADGNDIGDAVLSIASTSQQKQYDAHISAASNMLRIAEELSAFDEDLATEASEIAVELTKEAGLWDNIKNLGRKAPAAPLPRATPIPNNGMGMNGAPSQPAPAPQAPQQVGQDQYSMNPSQLNSQPAPMAQDGMSLIPPDIAKYFGKNESQKFPELPANKRQEVAQAIRNKAKEVQQTFKKFVTDTVNGGDSWGQQGGSLNYGFPTSGAGNSQPQSTAPAGQITPSGPVSDPAWYPGKAASNSSKSFFRLS